jgi:hypothetical protein
VAWGEPDQWDLSNEFHFVVADYQDGKRYPVVLTGERLAWLRDFAAKLYDAERRFLAVLDSGESPTDGDYAVLAQRWLLLKRQADAIAAELDEAREALIAYVQAQDRPELEGHGVRVTRSVAKGSVDYAKVLKQLGVEVSDDVLNAARRPDRVSWTVAAIRSQGAGKEAA